MDLSEAGGHGDRAKHLPSFSPGGQKILFSARQLADGQRQLDVFLMEADGWNPTNLPDAPSYDDFAAWILR